MTAMEIAAVLGAERLRELMAELFDRSAAVAQRFGGSVDKFTGDDIMAVFGAPVALEDHAIRMCLAALDIQRETEGIAAQVQRGDGVALQLRIGFNSGAVIAAETGSGALGYTRDRGAGRHGTKDGIGRPAGRGGAAGPLSSLVRRDRCADDPGTANLEGTSHFRCDGLLSS
jgi:hypothetical protein